MNTLQRLRQRSLWLALAGSSLLAACGGGSDTPAPPALSGTAAVGLPIVGGSVSVKCAGGSALSATTTASGGWNTTLSGQTLPCAVEVSSGTVGGASSTAIYHSIALTAGTVNITPLTSLVVASVLGASPATWFSSPVFTAFNASTVNTALNTLKTQLGLSAALGAADPLTTAFAANGSDALDKLLDALSDALTGAGLNYAALLAAAQNNSFSSVSGFSAAFGNAWTALGGGGGSPATCASGETATTYSGTAGTYSDGQAVCFAASPTQLAFLGKSLGSPVQNTAVSAPFSAYAFSDSATGERYEVIFNAGALYEINLLSSSAQFLGQFTPVISGGSGGTGNLTVEVLINGVGASSVTVSGVPTPGSQTDFCNHVEGDSTLTGLATGGGTLTINSCSFSNGVGIINATVTVTTPVSLSLPYTVRYIYS